MDVNRLEWQDSFSVGIKEVDDQHRTLVELLNQLHTAIRERRGSDACRETLDRLAEYTITHFQLEERLMQASNYAGFDVHKRQHEDLLG
ncbi:MAG TPA: bacteriohemerythrin, partial [Rhodocyclaceae bacterium]|nr:bacteriohemerythrin [Rhodocyclaceae bacterium]